MKYRMDKGTISRPLAASRVTAGMVGPKPFVAEVAKIENGYKNDKYHINKLIQDGKWEVLLRNPDSLSKKGVDLLKGACTSLVKSGKEKRFLSILNTQQATLITGKKSMDTLKRHFVQEKKNTIINGEQLKQFQWHDTSEQEVDYFNKVLKEFGITDKKSVTLFMATMGMESDKGSKKSEDDYGDKDYFKKKEYGFYGRGAGYIQLTTKETHLEFLQSKIIGSNFSGDDTATFIANKYPLEASVWYWLGSGGESKNLNDYAKKNKLNAEVFLITQYFVNGYPEGIDPYLRAIKEGEKYVIEKPKQNEEYGKLYVKDKVWRTPKGWEARLKSYYEAKKIFYD